MTTFTGGGCESRLSRSSPVATSLSNSGNRKDGNPDEWRCCSSRSRSDVGEEMTTLTCSACGHEKQADEFHVDNRNPRGRQYACKTCRGTNKILAQAAVKRTRLWRLTNPVGDMLRRARRRAKEENVPFM